MRVADEGGVLAFLSSAGNISAVGIMKRAVAAAICAWDIHERRKRREAEAILFVLTRHTLGDIHQGSTFEHLKYRTDGKVTKDSSVLFLAKS